MANGFDEREHLWFDPNMRSTRSIFLLQLVRCFTLGGLLDKPWPQV